MGNQATFRGDMVISKEKLPEFTERVLTILRQGGMMGIERVELCGKRIALLTPPVPDETGKVVCCFNYFEDDGRGNICYDTETGRFGSRDIGYLQFSEVVCTIYTLYEFYKAGAAYKNGEPFERRPYIGWLNYLFNEKFSDMRSGSSVPAERIPTMLFLSCKGSFGDDRAPFWKPIGDVCFSPEMQEWFQWLREELQATRAAITGQPGSKITLETLMDTLERVKEYGHLYAFREMFYDFAAHPDDQDRQAAVALLQRLVEEGFAELPPAGNGGWFDWQEKRFCPTRQQVKRYLAVMGNLALRKEFLKF